MDITKIKIQALVVSKLDCCNSLLAGTAGYQLDKLQCIQNMACRIITNLLKYDHISENMITLNWLKISERIMFKTAQLVYKCRCGLVPKYLHELPKTNKTRTLHTSYTTVMVPEFLKNEQPKIIIILCSRSMHLEHLTPPSKYSRYPRGLQDQSKTYLFKKSYKITEGPDNSNGYV